MTKREEIIAKLRAHEAELRAAGVARLALFGSAARDEQGRDSDIDLLVRLRSELGDAGFAYFECLDALSRRLQQILDRPVDIVTEPVNKDRLRKTIEEDQIVAF